MFCALLSLPPIEQVEEFFTWLRITLLGTFEVLLLILSMFAIVIVAWRHAKAVQGQGPAATEPDATRDPPARTPAPQTIYISLPKYALVNTMPCPACGHCKTRFRHRTPSGVTSKPASWGHLKTGQ